MIYLDLKSLIPHSEIIERIENTQRKVFLTRKLKDYNFLESYCNQPLDGLYPELKEFEGIRFGDEFGHGFLIQRNNEYEIQRKLSHSSYYPDFAKEKYKIVIPLYMVKVELDKPSIFLKIMLSNSTLGIPKK